MLSYYFQLALRSLKRNVLLTVLMIAAIGVGIGASMTTLTVFRAMSGDPIPRKSSRLFAVQLDNWGPAIKHTHPSSDGLESMLSYTDALGLMNAHAAQRQSAMYVTALALTPADARLKPFLVQARATYADFFPMFEVLFRFGAGWGAADDAAHGDAVVISRQLNDKLFGGANSVGKTLNLDNHEYRIVGVLDFWDPLPRFYDVHNSNKFRSADDLYLPFTRAIDAAMTTAGGMSCQEEPAGWEGILRSECIWTTLWVELPDATAVARYRNALHSYAADQQRAGRFHWPPNTQLRDVRQWLVYQHVVSDEVRILVLVSFSFLLVCMLNAMGLMLAKIVGRAGEIGVRRALGADRRAIFLQCLVEAAVVGLAGGLAGLALTGLGLGGLRILLSASMAALTRIDAQDVLIALSLAVVATILAALYPTWRAVQVQPAWQLKVQ